MSALGDEEQDLEEDLRERVDTSIDEALLALKSNAVVPITKELLEALLEKNTGTSYVVVDLRLKISKTTANFQNLRIWKIHLSS
jgi:hypothetical protein